VYLTLGKKHMKLWQSLLTRSCFRGEPRRYSIAGLRRELCQGLKTCRLVQLSSGLHYLQEDILT